MQSVSRSPEALLPMRRFGITILRMQESFFQQAKALAGQVVVPVIVEKAGEGVQDKQPCLHPQFAEVALVGHTADFGRHEAPIVQAAVERMQQLQNLGKV